MKNFPISEHFLTKPSKVEICFYAMINDYNITAV